MYALITGASSGAGKAFSTVLARDYKHDILLVSNQEQELNELAKTLSVEYQVRAIPYYCDLSHLQAAEQIHTWCMENHIEVDILINNAGMFFFEPLMGVPANKISTMLNLHIHTLTMLCRLFGKDMCQRNNQFSVNMRKGYIMNISSMTAWMSMPGIQVYNATKAYVLNFSKSLWYEMKRENVGVTVLTPGAIDTPLYGLNDKMRRTLVRTGISLTPEHFAQIAICRMFKGKKQAMPGWINHIAVPLINHLPDWVVFLAMKHLPQFNKK